MTKAIVALYDDVALAQDTAGDLLSAGIPRSDVSLISNETIAAIPGATGSEYSAGPLGGADVSGADLVQRLTGFGTPRDEAEIYAEGLRRGGSLVAVRTDDARADEVVAIMERRSAVELEDRAAFWRKEGWTGYDAVSPPYAAEAAAEERRRFAELESERYGGLREGKAGPIPVVEEEVKIGKREVPGGRVRVHSYIEELPVEEAVRLREEEVRVERRPADRPLSAAETEGAFRERTIEAEEVGEEAVVSKEARVVEEVAVGKDVREREEVVRDTARRTRVDVEGAKESREKPKRP